MINYDNQEQDAVKSNDQVNAGADVLLFGQNAPVLERIEKLLVQLLAATRRAGIPNPTLIDLRPGTTFSTTTRMRADLLITSGPGSDQMAVKVGSAQTFKWFSATSPIVLPLPIILDAGVDISVVDITTPGSVAWTAYIVAYTELEVPVE